MSGDWLLRRHALRVTSLREPLARAWSHLFYSHALHVHSYVDADRDFRKRLRMSWERVLRSTANLSARRQMSSTPKMHKASDKWAELTKNRPPKDHLDEHVRS